LGLFRIKLNFHILVADAGAGAAMLPVRDLLRDWRGAAGSNRRSFEFQKYINLKFKKLHTSGI
jgi:hypothetical protein